MYEFTDKHINDIKRKVKAYFQNSRLGLMKYDEINKADVDKEVDELYDNLEKQADKLIEGIVNELGTIYPINKKKYPKERLYEEYNPTLMYVYANEIERKRARYKEAIISNIIGKIDFQGKRKDFNGSTVTEALSNIAFLRVMNSNINNINRQIEETAIDNERGIILDYGKEQGEEFVRWVTAEDERVCGECGELHGQIFAIGDLPPRPHAGCRCEFEFVSKEELEKDDLI